MSPMRPSLSLCALSISLTLVCGALVRDASADEVRTGDSRLIRLDDNPSGGVVYRGDRGRTNHVAKLPSALTQLWRAKVRGGVDMTHVVSRDGDIIAISGSEMLELDREGKEKRKTRISDPPSQPPVITTNDDRILVTSKGDCYAFTAQGTQRYHVNLPQGLSPSSLLPSTSGGVVIQSGTTLVELDTDGQIIAQAKLPETPSTDLMARGDTYYMLGDKGGVISWKRPDAPKIIGSLPSPSVGSGVPTGGVLLDQRTLLAVLGSQDTVFFDLGTGSYKAGPSSVLIALDGTPALGTNGSFWITNTSGALLEIGADGKEKSRAILEPPAAPSSDYTSGGPPVIAADDGTVLFARDRAGVGLARAGAVVASTDKSPCADPLGLTADATRVVLSCRDGAIVALGDK
ncbi:MAG: hypothetical protein U0165_00380 [Polyangiaceae bacterium]